MIAIRNLTHIYKTQNEEVVALDNITLDIPKGEWLAVVGHNGSGKSTLARHLNALLLPSAGSISINGMETHNHDKIWEIRQKVAYVFQNPDNQIVGTTVEEDVAFGPENLGVAPEEIRSRVNMALKVVGMEAYREHAPHLLSGGQKQRVAIAGALAMEPEFLILDEATAMLDPRGRKEVLQTLVKLNKELGLTIIYITHYMEEVVFAHRVAVMDKGQIKILATPRELFTKVDQITKLGLDVPDVTLLASKLAAKGYLADSGIITINEMVDKLCQSN